MKIGIFKMTTLTLLLTCACATMLSGSRSDQGIDGSSGGVVAVSHGYMARLEQVHDGRMIGFGPFMGYYFPPENPGDLNRLRFVCFNENRFCSSDMPDGAKLYEGMAVRVTLTEAWLNTRPEPPGRLCAFSLLLRRYGTGADRSQQSGKDNPAKRHSR
jgi:hypothetical protein